MDLFLWTEMSEVQKKVKLEANKVGQTKGHDYSPKKRWVIKRFKIMARESTGGFVVSRREYRDVQRPRPI